jgi:electron transfer flavoprotein alpha subunit
LRDTVLASPGPYASDDIALLLARTADAAVACSRERLDAGNHDKDH